MATQIGPIILDGTCTVWTAAEALITPANTVASYQVYGAPINDNMQGGQNLCDRHRRDRPVGYSDRPE
jgi:hypothetical protein